VIPAQPLKLFLAPETGTKVLARLPSGRFPLLEEHVDFQGATWVKTRDADTRQEGWIVSEQGGRIWAARPKAVLEESRLVDNALDYLGWGYRLRGARYPGPIAGVSGLLLAPPTDSNCNTFTESVVLDAALEQGLLPRMTREAHRLWMVMELPRDEAGCAGAAVKLGLATALEDVDELPPSWTLCQGWTGRGGGHSFFILDSDPESQKILTLESNEAKQYRLSGPGFRHLGGLGNFPAPGHHPGASWQQLQVWTWQEFREAYPRVFASVLHVDGDTWAKTGRRT